MNKSPLLFLGVVATGLLTVTLANHRHSQAVMAHGPTRVAAASTAGTFTSTGTGAAPRQTAIMRGHAPNSDDMNQPTLQEALAEQDAKFLAEPASAAWAGPREHLIESTFSAAQLKQDAAPTPLRHEASCRSATCRINITYGNSADSQTATLSVLGHISSALPHTLLAEVPNPDGTVQLVLYADAGHPFPGHQSR